MAPEESNDEEENANLVDDQEHNNIFNNMLKDCGDSKVNLIMSSLTKNSFRVVLDLITTQTIAKKLETA